MRRGAFEVEAVAGLEAVAAVILQPNFEFAAKDVKKFLSFVGVGFAAVSAGLDAEKVWLHGGVAPGEQFHANFGAGFEDFALRRTDQELRVAIGVEHGKDVGLIEAGDALKSGNGGTHLAAFESAEETDRDIGGAGDLGERETTLETQAAKALAGRLAGIGRNGNHALLFQDVNDGGGIKAASPTQKKGALQQAHVGFGVHAVTAGSALRSNQAESFPGAQSGRRNAETASHVGDTQKTLER